MMFEAPVGAVRLPDYDQRKADEAVARLFTLLNFGELVRPGMKVTLKPNLLMKRRPEEATTTHPAVVRAVIRWLKGRGIAPQDITIADSPGGLYNHAALSGIYQATGMQAAAEEEGVCLNDDFTSVQVEIIGALKSFVFPVIRPAAEADLVINICKLKTHCMTGLSGGVKNLFGCIPGLTKPDYHWRYPKKEDFGQMLVDLCQAVSPAITFCDAVEAMEGDGPSSGQKREVGVLFASEAPYRLDRALCKFIGMPEERVPTIAAAVERGVLPEKGKVDVIGDPLPEIRPFTLPKTAEADFSSHVPGFLRGLLRPVADKWLAARPVVGEGCVGCGKCAESCPAHTIRIVKGRAVIDKGGCIRCFCCHEMCPIHVIDIRQNPLLRL